MWKIRPESPETGYMLRPNRIRCLSPLIDTGGIEPRSNDIILSQMREQAQIAMDMADVILFIVDGKEGLTAADRK